MLHLFSGGTEARRLGRFQVPWKELCIATIALIAVGAIAYGVSLWVSSRGNTAVEQPFDSTQGKPVAQPVQPAPVVTPAISFRVRAEGPWVEVGTARNGPEGRAIPIPWDQLVMLPVTPDNKAMWFEIAKLNPPPANMAYGNPDTGWSGYIQEGNKLILYGVSDYRQTEADPQVLSYWRREATIEGLHP